MNVPLQTQFAAQSHTARLSSQPMSQKTLTARGQTLSGRGSGICISKGGAAGAPVAERAPCSARLYCWVGAEKYGVSYRDMHVFANFLTYQIWCQERLSGMDNLYSLFGVLCRWQKKSMSLLLSTWIEIEGGRPWAYNNIRPWSIERELCYNMVPVALVDIHLENTGNPFLVSLMYREGVTRTLLWGGGRAWINMGLMIYRPESGAVHAKAKQVVVGDQEVSMPKRRPGTLW